MKKITDAIRSANPAGKQRIQDGSSFMIPESKQRPVNSAKTPAKGKCKK